MRRVAMAPLLALGVAAGLLVAACSSPAVSTDSRSVGQYGPGGNPSGQWTAAPGGQVQGARATAAAVGTSVAATPGPLRVQVTLRNMDQLREQLQILAGNRPTAVQLLAMVQDASGLMFELSQEISLMTPQQLDQAFGEMSDVTQEMSQVVQTYSNQVAAAATPGTMMTPGAMMGTPGTMMQGTPMPGMMTAQQMMSAIQQLRQQEMDLAGDQPTHADIINVLDQMNQMLVIIHQQLGQLSTSDLENLTASMGQAMADLGPVMQTRIRMDIGSVPTITPNQTVLPTLSTTPTLGPTTVPPATTTPAVTPATVPPATSTPMVTPATVPPATSTPAGVAPMASPIPTPMGTLAPVGPTPTP
ncbi:MAG: hypothetical protein M1370_01500 [Bacteroidetes bacterium]|nr:hypothetical protein [Bacteroidota bacterium]